MAVPDRLEQLALQNQVTGVDFVYVHPSQIALDVYFHNPQPAALASPLPGTISPSKILIHSPSGGETHDQVPVKLVSWVVVGARNVMRLVCAFPGDFSRYRLKIDDARIDRYYNDVWFSFKANCESGLDCEPDPDECCPDETIDFPVDYSARDFWSIRQVLLEFASQRYPNWQDRLEADAGMMLVEVMSALGDEFHYMRDRVSREGFFETATQRRSVRRHAALVDYHLHDGLGAFVWLDVQARLAPGNIAAGTPVTDSGMKPRATFEVGRGMAESFALPPASPKNYPVNPANNQFFAYQWTQDEVCLPCGSTETFIQGNHAATLGFDDFPPGESPGKWMLLSVQPPTPDLPNRAWVVRVIEVEDGNDPVFGLPYARLRWEAAYATPFELDLTLLQVHANIIPATSGSTQPPQRFTIGPPASLNDPDPALERNGPDRLVDRLDGSGSDWADSVAYLFSVPGTEDARLVYLGSAPDQAAPEIRLYEVTRVGPNWIPGQEWIWRRELLGTNSALPASRVFRLDDGTWKRVAAYRRLGADVIHRDYATDAGKTIRFGDGEFGMNPAVKTVFETVCRVDDGRSVNVAAGTLTKLVHPLVASVSNPTPATGAVDAETVEQAKQFAPEAFRAVTFRAVKPEDYAEAAERLAWVQRAGAKFRWTGSWLTAFVTPDPKGSFELTPAERKQLDAQLDRFRQAGRPARSLNPVYATLDLKITICVAEFAYRGEVEERVLERLFGTRGMRPRPGFFDPDNFTFGTPLERSQLEDAIQEVPGVKAVEEIEIRRRGWFDWRPFLEFAFTVSPNEVIRVENSQLLPERGSVNLVMQGGA